MLVPRLSAGLDCKETGPLGSYAFLPSNGKVEVQAAQKVKMVDKQKEPDYPKSDTKAHVFLPY